MASEISKAVHIGLLVKGAHKKQPACEAHTARHGYVTGMEVTPGNVHDSEVFDDVYDQITESSLNRSKRANDNPSMTRLFLFICQIKALKISGANAFFRSKSRCGSGEFLKSALCCRTHE